MSTTVTKVNRSLRIFIAGASAMREQIRFCIERLGEFGHFGYDWTRDPGWDNPARYYPLTVANRDLAEVTLADGVIWVLDGAPSHGAPYEVGYADRGGQPIVVLWNGLRADSGQPQPNLLYAYRHTFTHDLEEAVAEMERMVAARDRDCPLIEDAIKRAEAAEKKVERLLRHSLADQEENEKLEEQLFFQIRKNAKLRKQLGDLQSKIMDMEADRDQNFLAWLVAGVELVREEYSSGFAVYASRGNGRSILSGHNDSDFTSLRGTEIAQARDQIACEVKLMLEAVKLGRVPGFCCPAKDPS